MQTNLWSLPICQTIISRTSITIATYCHYLSGIGERGFCFRITNRQVWSLGHSLFHWSPEHNGLFGFSRSLSRCKRVCGIFYQHRLPTKVIETRDLILNFGLQCFLRLEQHWQCQPLPTPRRMARRNERIESWKTFFAATVYHSPSGQPLHHPSNSLSTI